MKNHSQTSYSAGRIGALLGTIFGLLFADLVSADPAQVPLFVASPVRPITMLNMSKEHQLYFKLYDDYSDITNASGGAPDQVADTTYNNNYKYYGYFNSDACYKYSDGRFVFDSYRDADLYCNKSPNTGQWSGNFLNWATMTRMDAIRKILYGGMRSTDTATETVLERAFLPNDAHSFAKYYGGSDADKLTPFSPDTTNEDLRVRGLTICNTSEPSDRSKMSHQSIGADLPLLRITKGNYALWASNERWQCRWGTGTNDNAAASSGISAYSSAPSLDQKFGEGDYTVRVKVCSQAPNVANNEHCKVYGDNYKPIGLLQTYGYNDAILFGLMTGSYKNNKSGGVLRKAVGSISDEINTDGTFKIPASGKSIIGTINLLRIYGYRFDDGTYHSKDGSDNCLWATASFNNGSCTNWGNPQGEIYLESLRYLAGKSATAAFAADDSTKIAGLNSVATFTDPISTESNGNYCAPINVLQFNASSTSYDGDELGGASDISGVSTYETATNTIGEKEGFIGTETNPVKVFIGENGVVDANDKGYQLCSAKTVRTFSQLAGICPESPRLQGSYKIAGLAYLARKNGIASNRQKVKTFGVALAPAMPKISVAVPNVTGKAIDIIPACRNTGMAPNGSCAIVDFKIVSNTLSSDGSTASGKLYVNWEDSEHGGDYDQDMWGTIEYSITSTEVKVKTKVYAKSADYKMGFGYVISGTTADGYHAHSGINNYSYTNAANTVECNSCNKDDAATEKKYDIGATTAKTLMPPLYYAAKWGGYKTDSMSADDIAASTPETYFYATDPYKLEASLQVALEQIKATNGSAATVAANSTRLDTQTLVYQATFNAEDWSGGLTALKLNANGTIGDKKWSTDTTLTRASTRKIYTFDGATSASRSVVLLGSSALPTTSAPNLSAALRLASESDNVNAFNRYKWLLGNNESEEPNGLLRKRTLLLGDIVNSDPAFAGRGSQRYEDLSSTYGGPSYAAYVVSKGTKTSDQYDRKAAVFVGSNDGMLHAFDADTGAELFAYIPRGVYGKLADLTKPSYSHQYLVDGPTYAGDVYYDSNGDGVKEWRTLVTGTLGGGGRGAYALDVTDVLATGAAPKVVFDISANDSSLTYKDDIGYAAGKAFTVPMKDGTWRVVFGNGNNSVNGFAKLFAIDIQSPSSVISIDTQAKDGTTTNNGLNGLALLPDGNGIISAAYSGDVIGNMWKFDLSTANSNNWDVAFKSSGTPKPLVRVIDSAGNPQPIFASPTLGYNDLKKVNGVSPVMVYFGTGKYYDTTDNSSTSVQSIYAILDKGGASDYLTLTTTNRTTLLQQKSITAQDSTTRTISPDATAADGTKAVNWDTKYGWFLDLQYNSSGGGERVLSKPLLLYDRLIIPTFKPSSNQCDYGGSGWLMQLTGVGDKFIGQNILDTTNANHAIDGVILGDLLPIITGERIAILGSGMRKSANGNGTETTLNSYGASTPGGVRGRMSWRQIK